MNIHEVEEFKYGTINTIEDKAIPDGAASDSDNWLTEGSHIELRRGSKILGTESAGTDPITGLHKGEQYDGTEIVWRTYGKKVEYYDADTDTWIEVGTNLLGTAADGEEIRFTEYDNLAGRQTWFSSPNCAGLFKLLNANPGNAVNQYASGRNFKGYIRGKIGRMLLWNRGGNPKDTNNLYGSKIDKDEVSDYTQTTSEQVGTQNGVTKTFAGSLSAVTGVKTCFAVVITDGTETFQDDQNGNLVGDLGGTGTINYATGAYSVTFNTAPTVNPTADYYTEDATDGGPADYRYTGAGRVAGEGFFLPQPLGGALMDVLSLQAADYCFHAKKTYTFNTSDDDSDAFVDVYRGQLGIPNHRAAVEAPDGIYFVDDSNSADPQFKVLEVGPASGLVEPRSVSKPFKINKKMEGYDLSNYRFDKAASILFGKYVVFACRTKDSVYNDTVFTINTDSKAIERHDYFVNMFEIYNGELIAGDSLSSNVYVLFSGFDDDESLILNNWEGSLSRLGIDRLKKNRVFELSGLIDINQKLRVYISLDNDGFTEFDPDGDGTPAVDGDGDYVDKSTAVTIGPETIGSNEIGGGGSAVTASPYYRRIKIPTGKFRRAKIRFQADGIGYVSVSMYRFADIRTKEHKPPSKYRV